MQAQVRKREAYSDYREQYGNIREMDYGNFQGGVSWCARFRFMGWQGCAGWHAASNARAPACRGLSGRFGAACLYLGARIGMAENPAQIRKKFFETPRRILDWLVKGEVWRFTLFVCSLQIGWFVWRNLKNPGKFLELKPEKITK